MTQLNSTAGLILEPADQHYPPRAYPARRDDLVGALNEMSASPGSNASKATSPAKQEYPNTFSQDGRKILPGFVVGEWGKRIGLEPADRIVEIDGVPVKNDVEGRAMLESLAKTKLFSISLLRDGQPITFNYELR